MTVKKVKAPGHLSGNTKKWFEGIANDYELESHHIKMLILAAEAWDRCCQARIIIDKEGMTFVNRFDEVKARPEIAIERDSKILFARLIRELNLDTETPEESRPPALRYGG